MALSIPSGVLVKYKEVIDSTISTDMFGIVCQLVFIDSIEVISNTFDNIPEVKSTGAHRRHGPTQYKRQTSTFKDVERFEDITIKVYWTPRDFVMPSKNIVLPDGAIQIIGYQSDLPKIRQAKAFIPNKNNEDMGGVRYKMWKEPFPMGIGKDRYFGAFMEYA